MTEMQQHEIKTQWRSGVISLTVAFLVALILFYETMLSLVMTWWDKPEYNHCLLILPIIAYLLHERREIFHKIAPKPYWPGLIPLLGGGVLWLLGDLADVNVVRQFGLIILLQGCVLTILGKRVVHALLFPFFYMIFLVPFGDFLVPALQDFTTAFVVTVLNIMNIPVYVDGVFLSIPAGDFHVAEACAGLRFLVATVALGTLMANVSYKTKGRQVIVVVLSFVVPVIANGFRASGIILIAHWSDMEYATGADHIIYGWIFFAAVLLIFITIAMTFTNRSIHDGYIDFSRGYWSNNEAVPSRKFYYFLLPTVIMIGLAPYYATVIEQRFQAYEDNILILDNNIWGNDARDITNWKPEFAGASQSFHLQYDRMDSAAIDVFVAYYKYQSPESEMIRYGNDMVPDDIWMRIENRLVDVKISGKNSVINEMLIQSGGRKRLVWYYYWVDGKVITSNYQAKLLDAKAKLMGGRLDSAVVALSLPLSPYGDNIEQQRKKLRDYLSILQPLDGLISMTSGKVK